MVLSLISVMPDGGVRHQCRSSAKGLGCRFSGHVQRCRSRRPVDRRMQGAVEARHWADRDQIAAALMEIQSLYDASRP